MPDLTVCPARLAGGRTTNRSCLALNGRGFDGDHARASRHRGDDGQVQREQAGVKHGGNCIGWVLGIA